jgi:hypothetical protein
MFVVLITASKAATFTGVITDTMCGERHGVMKNQPDDQCVRTRAKGHHTYALFDATNVIKLSDQRMPRKIRGTEGQVY